MSTFAPIVLSFLEKFSNCNQSSGGGILDISMEQTRAVNQQPSNQGLLKLYLDRDGDGNVMDDIGRYRIQKHHG